MTPRRLSHWLAIVAFWALVAVCVVAVIGAGWIVWSVTR